MAEEFEPFYLWWNMWREGGKDYAENFRSLSPLTARQNHTKHLSFGWAAGKDDAVVSDLWFFRAAATDVVQEGRFRDEPSGLDVRTPVVNHTRGYDDALPF